MSRKHFTVFAEEIRFSNLPKEERRRAAELIAAACRRCNPNFDRARFFAACQLD